MEGKLGLHVRILGLGMINFIPALRQHMVRIIDQDRTAEAATSGIVLQRERIVDWPALARITDRSAEKLWLGEMGAKARLPVELAGRCRRLLEDDVRDLTRQPSDSQARGVDDLDPLDIGGWNLLKLIDRAARFVGDALAVDQHILRRLPEAAL